METYPATWVQRSNERIQWVYDVIWIRLAERRDLDHRSSIENPSLSPRQEQERHHCDASSEEGPEGTDAEDASATSHLSRTLLTDCPEPSKVELGTKGILTR